MDSNPYDEKPSNEPVDMNAPIALPFEDGNQASQALTGARDGHVSSWYTIGGITLVACFVLFLIGFSAYQSARSQRREVSTPPTLYPNFTPRPAATPNLTATQIAWVKPSESPILANAEEADRANEENSVDTLMQRSIIIPDQPEINQPGDVYIFEIRLSQSEPLRWTYGWCATTNKILEENFAQMKLEFVMNGAPISDDYIATNTWQRDSDSGGGSCRSYIALITNWPSGTHQLEVRVTFLLPTNDGWNLYPAGTHIFKYFVFVED